MSEEKKTEADTTLRARAAHAEMLEHIAKAHAAAERMVGEGVRSRESSLVLTKLDEARHWASDIAIGPR